MEKKGQHCILYDNNFMKIVLSKLLIVMIFDNFIKQ